MMMKRLLLLLPLVALAIAQENDSDALPLERARPVKDCDHIACTREYRPVCGSNGKTYSNKCMLGVAQCRNPSIKLLHTGRCRLPSATTSRALRPCDWMCTMDYTPICGSDGKTYSNKCMFSLAKCRKNDDPNMYIVHDGECDPTKKLRDCPYEFACLPVDQPVCGSDGHTYTNDCILKMYACQTSDKALRVVQDGPCMDQQAQRNLRCA